MAILDARTSGLGRRPPLDVEDVRRAHELLSERDWQVNELFAE
jgi:hypothetical protein